MKLIKLSLFIVTMALFAACNSAGNSAGNTAVDLESKKNFGASITADGSISMQDLLTKMEDAEAGELNTKVSGVIEEVCQKKGCWMTLKKDDGSNMRVTFRDYGFFVPTDCAGKEVVIQGTAQYDTTSVADLRHYAEDAGQSKEEIEAITEPEIEITFVADGVVFK